MKYAVTGGFGYSGSAIVRQLLEQGIETVTLTNSPRKPDSPPIAAYPLRFDDHLTAALRGVDVLVNTYWVRFNHHTFTHRQAVENSRSLFAAARRAGVQRIVHVSITNPDEHSSLEYFSGKAQVEQALIASGIPYAILRPAVLFGGDDILINNIAWLLRTLPVFGIFGDGHYRLQPIHVDDLAGLAVRYGQSRENCIVNAIGPETFTYRDLVTTLANILGLSRPVLSVPPAAGYAVGWLMGRILGDVTITRDEIEGLMANLLYVDAPPAGTTALTTWAAQHTDQLGRRYASELARRAYTPPNRTSVLEPVMYK